MTESYDESKFKEFNRMLNDAGIDSVIIHHPQVIGDTYEEMVENLNRLSDSKMHLIIVPRINREP